MHGTHVRDLKQSLALRIVERSGQFDPSFDVIDAPDPGFAFGAIFRMALLVAQMHGDTLEAPLLPVGVHPERHRRTGPQRRQQQVVR